MQSILFFYVYQIRTPDTCPVWCNNCFGIKSNAYIFYIFVDEDFDPIKSKA